MSNKKHRKKDVPLRPKADGYVILREENKEEIAKLLRYPIETVEAMLEKAAAEGYSGVRLDILNHR